MEKILAIIRSSSERQETESQKKELVEFILTKGYKNEEIRYIEVAGASARKRNAKYEEMIENIKDTLSSNSDLEAIAIWHLNRLGRVESALTEMKEWFIKHGIQVFVKNPSLTLLNDDGSVNEGVSIAWGVFASLVKIDTDEMFLKMRRGKRRNAEVGMYNGGVIKYGYTKNENNLVVPLVEEQKIIQLIFEEYSTRKYSIKTLQDELNERGVRLRGKKITQHLINKIIKDTAYIGGKLLEGDNGKYERKYIPIVDDELWQKVKDIREGNTQKTKDKTTSGEQHFALKILRCKICGYNYIHSHDYYTCFQRAAGFRNVTTPKRCTESIGIKDKYIDGLLWSVAKLYYVEYLSKNQEDVIENLKKALEIQKQKQKEIACEIERYKDFAKKLFDLYQDNVYSEEEYKKKLQELKNTKEKNKFQQTNIDETIENLQKRIDTDSQADDFQYLWDKANVGEENAKNKIVHQYISETYINRDILTIEPLYNNSPVSIITITCIDDRIFKFAYFPKKQNELLQTFKFEESTNSWVLWENVDYGKIKYAERKQKEYDAYADWLYQHSSQWNSAIQQMKELSMHCGDL